jgi:hypothetical protein
MDAIVSLHPLSGASTSHASQKATLVQERLIWRHKESKSNPLSTGASTLISPG